MQELIIGVVVFLGGGLVGYLTSYFKGKGKNRALKEDIAALEDEKQNVSSKYAAELEELKKKHSLDVELRKNKYHEKREQFSKYFALLDQFNSKSNSVFMERFPQIYEQFMLQYLDEDRTKDKEAIAYFNGEIQSLFNELYQEQLVLKTETNSIRLISSPKLDKLLDSLESEVVRSTDLVQKMLKVMTSQEFWSDQSILQPLQQQVEKSSMEAKSLHNKIKMQMKTELNEI